MPSDLDPLYAPPPDGPGQSMMYRQATILAFDPVTLSNTVRVGTTSFTDLPLLGVAEADTYVPGSAVWVVSTGLEYAIIGRLVRPNTTDATAAVNKLSSQIQTASVATGETRTSTTFGDLTTVGPIVYPIVRSSGRLLVFMSASMGVLTNPAGSKGGQMCVQIDGPVSYAATALPQLSFDYDDNATHVLGNGMATARYFLLEGLTPGAYTVTAKYKAGPAGSQCQFADRNVTTIAI